MQRFVLAMINWKLFSELENKSLPLVKNLIETGLLKDHQIESLHRILCDTIERVSVEAPLFVNPNSKKLSNIPPNEIVDISSISKRSDLSDDNVVSMMDYVGNDSIIHDQKAIPIQNID